MHRTLAATSREGTWKGQANISEDICMNSKRMTHLRRTLRAAAYRQLCSRQCNAMRYRQLEVALNRGLTGLKEYRTLAEGLSTSCPLTCDALNSSFLLFNNNTLLKVGVEHNAKNGPAKAAVGLNGSAW